MGVYQRDYMRERKFGGQPFGVVRGRVPPATKLILIAIGVGFVLQLAMEAANARRFEALFGLSPVGLRHGMVWQLVTYAFLHSTGSVLHLLLNAYVIYMFGRSVEQQIGRQAFLLLFLGSVVTGGLLWALMNWNEMSTVIGASAGAYGLLIAFATLDPNRMLFLFFPPMVVPAKWLAVGIVVFEVLFGWQRMLVAWEAHLGGALAGYLFIRHGVAATVGPGRRMGQSWGRRSGQRTGPELTDLLGRVVSRLPRRSRPSWHRTSQAEAPIDAEVLPDDYMAREIDPILDKISAGGFQSLTREERRKLEDYHRRL